MNESTSHALVLAEQLRERIRHAGPITFRDWMKVALYDPVNGYYCRPNQTRWGREGDYRTSPERSSLFAATFAKYFAGLYQQLGEAMAWTIAEVGAGDGHFAYGVLEKLQRFFPEVFSATTYVIDEISTASRSVAHERLQPFAERVRFQTLRETEIDSGVVFSNELLDAFPVHRVSIRDGQLQEFYVKVGANGKFEWHLAAPSTPRLSEYLQPLGIMLAEGEITEINPGIVEWLQQAAARIRNGYLVTVDYGVETDDLSSATNHHRETLRGFRRHSFVDDLLAKPGEHDLTTSVDWNLVKSAGTGVGLQVVEFARQDKFLLAAGLLEELELATSQCESEAERLRITTAARAMILPHSMASHFQVLVQKKS